MPSRDIERQLMLRAVELAQNGEGAVEPNPMVGCVVAHGEQVVGEGWHAKYGGPHAEVVALKAAGDRAQGATLYVTLEPCSHHGKTPPCADAVIRAGIARVVVAQPDPFPEVGGTGIQRMRDAGLDVELGLLADKAQHLNAPYLKLVQQSRPWVIAKWAMTLDGKIATSSGDSKWITGETARARGRRLRQRMDAILVGSGTTRTDDPLLTARPPGPRTLTRVVLDSLASLPSSSQLVSTAHESPVLVVVGPEASGDDRRRLMQHGCEVIACNAPSRNLRLGQLLDELGRRRMTNLLVEGGGGVLGELFDLGQIDEVHVFIAPKLVGGAAAPNPVRGVGADRLAEASQLENLEVEQLAPDIYLHGRVITSATQ